MSECFPGAAYPTDLLPYTNLNTPLNNHAASCVTVVQSTYKSESVLASMIDNSFHRQAGDGYDTWIPFNPMTCQEEKRMNATFSDHYDSNAFYFTHPPPSTYVIAPTSVFDPPAPAPTNYTPPPQVTADSSLVPSPPPSDSGSLSKQSPRTMEEDIRNNMGYEEKVAKWICHKCKKCNSRKKRMRDHVAYCLGYRLYLCDRSCGFDNCPGEFKTDQNRKDHRHPQVKKCLKCHKIVRRQNLQRHMGNVHGQRA